MASTLRSMAQYGRLLARSEGASGKLELSAAIARAALSRLVRGRGVLHVRRPVVIADAGLRFRVPTWDNSFASAPAGEANSPVVPVLMELLRRRPRSTLIDVGANLGYVCMCLAAHFPECRVLAIEPIPWLAEALVATAALNGLDRVTVLSRAASPVPEVALQVPRLGGVWLTTLSSSAASVSREARGVTRETVNVRGTPLDQLLEEAAVDPADVAAVKIDVEGAEAAVLATAPRLLGARPPVVFEALDTAARAEVEAVLRAKGYNGFEAIDGTNCLARADTPPSR